MNKEKLIELKSAMGAEAKINEEIAGLKAKFEEEHIPLFRQKDKSQILILICLLILIFRGG